MVNPLSRPKFPFPTHNTQEIVAWQPPNITPIIDHGILLPQTRCVLYGSYKAWKSMMAMNMAYCIAMGRPWLGYETNTSSVLIIQYEVPHAEYRKRVQKFSSYHAWWPTHLNIVTPFMLKLDKAYSRPIVELYLKYFRPGVIVIDPIYKALSGDISSSYDVSSFIDMIDGLMAEYDFATILVHHERKHQYTPEGDMVTHGSQDMMGSSYIPNWLDTAIQLDRINDIDVDLSFTAMRHAEEELLPMRLRFSHDTLTPIIRI